MVGAELPQEQLQVLQVLRDIEFLQEAQETGGGGCPRIGSLGIGWCFSLFGVSLVCLGGLVGLVVGLPLQVSHFLSS